MVSKKIFVSKINSKKKVYKRFFLNKKILLSSLTTILVSVPIAIGVTQIVGNNGYSFHGKTFSNLKSAVNYVKDNSIVSEQKVEGNNSKWNIEFDNKVKTFNTPEELRSFVYNNYIKIQSINTNLDLSKFENEKGALITNNEFWQNTYKGDSNINKTIYQGYNDGWWNNPKVIYRNTKIKNIFGGQEYEFQLRSDWANEINSNLTTEFDDNTVNWLGKGKKINYYFDLYLNQDYFLELLNNNATFKSNWEIHLKNVSNELSSYLKESLKDFFTEEEINEFIPKFVNLARKLLTSKLIPEQQHVTAKTKSIVQIDNAIDNLLRKKISNEVLKLIPSNYVYLFNELLTTRLNKKYKSQEKIGDTNNIYVFKYNDNPLFKLDYEAFKTLYSVNEFRENPLKTVKNKIKDDLSINKVTALNMYASNMVNISNSYIDDVDKDVMSNTINKDAIDNYFGNGKTNNLTFASKTIESSSFDQKYQDAFIDEERFKKYNISHNDLVKKLNLFENEEITYLNSPWGILESVYQYNKNLESLLNKKVVTDLAKKQLEENYIKDPNNIVVLFEKNKKFKNVRYAEYFNNGYKFNESLWDVSSILVHSNEYKEKWIDLNKLNKS